jgi:hypothetical protein
MAVKLAQHPVLTNVFDLVVNDTYGWRMPASWWRAQTRGSLSAIGADDLDTSVDAVLAAIEKALPSDVARVVSELRQAAGLPADYPYTHELVALKEWIETHRKVSGMMTLSDRQDLDAFRAKAASVRKQLEPSDYEAPDATIVGTLHHWLGELLGKRPATEADIEQLELALSSLRTQVEKMSREEWCTAADGDGPTVAALCGARERLRVLEDAGRWEPLLRESLERVLRAVTGKADVSAMVGEIGTPGFDALVDNLVSERVIVEMGKGDYEALKDRHAHELSLQINIRQQVAEALGLDRTASFEDIVRRARVPENWQGGWCAWAVDQFVKLARYLDKRFDKKWLVGGADGGWAQKGEGAADVAIRLLQTSDGPQTSTNDEAASLRLRLREVCAAVLGIKVSEVDTDPDVEAVIADVWKAPRRTVPEGLFGRLLADLGAEASRVLEATPTDLVYSADPKDDTVIARLRECISDSEMVRKRGLQRIDPVSAISVQERRALLLDAARKMMPPGYFIHEIELPNDGAWSGCTRRRCVSTRAAELQRARMINLFFETATPPRWSPTLDTCSSHCAISPRSRSTSQHPERRSTSAACPAAACGLATRACSTYRGYCPRGSDAPSSSCPRRQRAPSPARGWGSSPCTTASVSRQSTSPTRSRRSIRQWCRPPRSITRRNVRVITLFPIVIRETPMKT